MKPRILLLFLLSTGGFAAETDHALLFGYGSSVPGWGKTTERVHTADLSYRYARVLSSPKSPNRFGCSHELWVELPLSFILSDSDDMDDQDIGFVGLTFLSAWVFPVGEEVHPYFFLGGGPLYMLADIEGVGSDTPGNYQTGAGLRLLKDGQKHLNLDVRYHHISNLGLADPNVSLNSFKVNLGFSFHF